jgi:hypothetical protein
MPAQADHGAVLVVPGRADVPVMIHGHDASWAVVEGDWGLHRPGGVGPTVTYPYRVIYPYGRHPGYFPSTGKRPLWGRYEIVPPADRRLPEPAESFHRYWSSESGPVNVAAPYPPYDPPPVILAPKFDTPPLRSLD